MQEPMSDDADLKERRGLVAGNACVDHGFSTRRDGVADPEDALTSDSISSHNRRSAVKAIDKIIPETRATDLRAFWTLTPEHIYAALHCGNSGLDSQDAELRLAQYGSNSDAQGKTDSLARAVFRRLLEPLSLILLAAGIAIRIAE